MSRTAVTLSRSAGCAALWQLVSAHPISLSSLLFQVGFPAFDAQEISAACEMLQDMGLIGLGRVATDGRRRRITLQVGESLLGLLMSHFCHLLH